MKHLIRVFLFLVLCSFTPGFSEPYAYLTPPQAWEIANPESYAPSVSICFVKKGKSHFPISINLASEKNSVSIDEYLQAVKHIHESDKRSTWKKLGTVNTKAGQAVLTQIDTPTDFGPARMLQLIFLKDQKAYVITAAALKKEIGSCYASFMKTFKSFTITSDLLNSIDDKQRKIHLVKKIERIKRHVDWNAQWGPFQKSVMKDYSDLGVHWQLLLLNDIHKACELQEKIHEKQ